MLAHAVLPSEGRGALDSAERTFTRADAFVVQLVRDLERCAAPVSIPGGSGYGSADKSRASLRASNWNPFRFPSIAVRPDGTCQRLRQRRLNLSLDFSAFGLAGLIRRSGGFLTKRSGLVWKAARREFSGGLRRPRRPDRSGPGLASSGRCQHAGDPDYTNQRSCGRASGFSPSVARGLDHEVSLKGLGRRVAGVDTLHPERTDQCELENCHFSFRWSHFCRSVVTWSHRSMIYTHGAATSVPALRRHIASRQDREMTWLTAAPNSRGIDNSSRPSV